MDMKDDQSLINVNMQNPEDKSGSERDHQDHLMFYTDRCIGPDVRTGEERVPRLDPLRSRAKGTSNALTGIVGLAGVGLRARLWVGGSQRGDTNIERRSGPNIRAGDVAIELLDLTRGKRKLGLDGRAGKAWSVRRRLQEGQWKVESDLPCFASGVAIGLGCASRGTLRGLVGPVGYADWCARPDVITSQERILRLDGTINEVKIVFNGTASLVGLGDVGRLAGWGWSRRARRRTCGRTRGRTRGASRLGRLIRAVGNTDGSINPDVIAGEEGVSSKNGSRLKIELILNRGAGVSGLGGITRLASRRWWSLGRPRATTEPGAIAVAVTTDDVICGKIGAFSNCEEREAPGCKGVDSSIVERSSSSPVESLVREREMGVGVGLIGEIRVELDRVLLVSACRITRIEVPKDDRLSMLLLDIVGDRLIDTTVRRTVGYSEKVW